MDFCADLCVELVFVSFYYICCQILLVCHGLGLCVCDLRFADSRERSTQILKKLNNSLIPTFKTQGVALFVLFYIIVNAYCLILHCESIDTRHLNC